MRTLCLTLLLAATQAAAGVRCRALEEDGSTLAEADAEESLTCRLRLKEEVRRLKCDGRTRQYPYRYQRDGQSPVPAVLHCTRKEAR